MAASRRRRPAEPKKGAESPPAAAPGGTGSAEKAENAEEAVVCGQVERIVFHNPENGFTVLRVLPDGESRPGRTGPLFAPEAVNCVGHMAQATPGVRISLRGRWVQNPRFGRQLAFEQAEELLPATEEGLRLYLGSGLIKGVGPELAARIVKKFGADTIRVLDEEPEKLLRVRGIGERSIGAIRESWARHRGMRDLLLFLRPHGVSAAMAVRIYKFYGAEALEVVRQNPYRLAMDVRGIGFLTADSVGAKLGFPADHPLRIQAAALYTIAKASEEGHVYLPKERVSALVCNQVACGENLVDDALRVLEQEKRLVLEELPDGGEAVYLRRFHHCESKISYYLTRLIRTPKAVVFENPEKMAREVAEDLGLELAPEQREAIDAAAVSKLLTVTGGPGTGKTTIIRGIINLFRARKTRILLAAPTGRAAKRMSEATGIEARTIHRLLEYSPMEDQFARNEDNPLACGLLVVDEASMMDTLLFYHLLKAVPLGATLILVGDVHQLPSVGPGNVLADIIASGVAPVIKLSHIFRQSAESEIIMNAHMINAGQMPSLARTTKAVSDFYFIEQNDPEKAAELMVSLVKEHIPRRFGLNPVEDVQVLTPMHKGPVGAMSMNARLQAELNPDKPEIRRGETTFRLHDKVMQIRNNYEKDVYNGDIGRISCLNPQDRELSVDFDGRVLPYGFDELDELTPAYAISIHKSQGSEYPAVVIPIMMSHYILLQRNLIYTGVTRGKKLVILVGESRALAMAVRNNRTQNRFTRLRQRLEDARL